MTDSASHSPLAAWRKSQGVPQYRLAADLGVTQPFISRIERGATMSLDLAVRVFNRTGLRLGPLAHTTQAESAVVARVIAPAEIAG